MGSKNEKAAQLKSNSGIQPFKIGEENFLIGKCDRY